MSTTKPLTRWTHRLDLPGRARSAAPEASPPWAALSPGATVTVPAVRADEVLPSLSPGTPVALVSNRLLSRAVLRRLCRVHGVEIERELVALPSVVRPLVLFDDAEDSVRHFWNAVATVPPAPAWVTAPATAALALAAHAPWRWTGAVVPGRVLLGVRR